MVENMDKRILSKTEILSTGNWSEGKHIDSMERYYWNSEYTRFYMRIFDDGFATILEKRKDENNKLFEGYITNIEELNQVVHLLRLNN